MAASSSNNLHGTLSTSICSLPRLNPSRLSHSRPIVAILGQHHSYWATLDANIEAHLKKSIPIRPPTSVFEPMHNLTFAAPKTTAPSLCIAACDFVGGSPDDAIEAASALHLMHAAAFTHQHLPLTDGPIAGPGPTIQHAYNPNIELLTPDGIVPFGFELLGRSAQNPDKILRVIIEISHAVGSKGLVDGLYQEMLYNNNQSKGKEEMIEYICEKKEGELHACAGACGAILGGGSEEEIEKLRKFGLYVGMIQGMLYGVGRNMEEGRRSEVVAKLRRMALKELEIFSGRKVDQISSLAEANL